MFVLPVQRGSLSLLLTIPFPPPPPTPLLQLLLLYVLVSATLRSAGDQLRPRICRNRCGRRSLRGRGRIQCRVPAGRMVQMHGPQGERCRWCVSGILVFVLNPNGCLVATILTCACVRACVRARVCVWAWPVTNPHCIANAYRCRQGNVDYEPWYLRCCRWSVGCTVSWGEVQ